MEQVGSMEIKAKRFSAHHFLHLSDKVFFLFSFQEMCSSLRPFGWREICIVLPTIWFYHWQWQISWWHVWWCPWELCMRWVVVRIAILYMLMIHIHVYLVLWAYQFVKTTLCHFVVHAKWSSLHITAAAQCSVKSSSKQNKIKGSRIYSITSLLPPQLSPHFQSSCAIIGSSKSSQNANTHRSTITCYQHPRTQGSLP